MLSTSACLGWSCCKNACVCVCMSTINLDQQLLGLFVSHDDLHQLDKYVFLSISGALTVMTAQTWMQGGAELSESASSARSAFIHHRTPNYRPVWGAQLEGQPATRDLPQRAAPRTANFFTRSARGGTKQQGCCVCRTNERDTIQFTRPTLQSRILSTCND